MEAEATTDTKEPAPSLWNEDESWTDDALRIDLRFKHIVERFYKEYPEYKIRDMEMLLLASVNTTALGLILDKRFGR